MPAEQSSSPFADLPLAPRDPILGVTEAFKKDTRKTKANLGSGVYSDENGKLPLLKAVYDAEQALVDKANPRGYLPMEGFAAYNREVQGLLFGPDSDLAKAGRAATFESLGGTGALKIGADFLKRLNPDADVYISDPSWENHQALFEYAGFEVKTYPYYDAANNGVNFRGMIDAIAAMPVGAIVVLHVCCHNPTGLDITERNGRRSSRHAKRARSFHSWIWLTRGSPKASKKTRSPWICLWLRVKACL